MEVRLFTVLRSRVELRSQVLEFLRRVRKSADYALSLSPFHHRRSRKTWERKRRNFSRRPTQITAVLESHRNKHSRKPIHGGEVGAENPSRKQTMRIRSGGGRKGSVRRERPGKTCRDLTKLLLLSTEASSKVMAPLSGRHCCIFLLQRLLHAKAIQLKEPSEKRVGAVRLLKISSSLSGRGEKALKRGAAGGVWELKPKQSRDHRSSSSRAVLARIVKQRHTYSLFPLAFV